ncbi:MAG: hypothetical protein EAZ44_09275 [Cytophagia bacterium]|nr:MAG: hypothetical protein EAZ44_09275 [Cytophagia bacterium]TAG37881.1 MAG: hypothetical protein EAZ31_11025 [Cytophagia bacterium]
MKKQKYACANCHKRLPINSIWLLSDYTKVQCKHCGYINKSKTISKYNYTFIFGFLIAYSSASILLRYYDDLFKGLFYSVLFFVLPFYLLVVLYTYQTKKFDISED